MDKKYIDLTLIKNLIKELENYNDKIEDLVENKSDYVATQLEIAKALGLTLFIAHESELLATDYKKLSNLVMNNGDTDPVKLKISAEDLFNSIDVSNKKKTNKN